MELLGFTETYPGANNKNGLLITLNRRPIPSPVHQMWNIAENFEKIRFQSSLDIRLSRNGWLGLLKQSLNHPNTTESYFFMLVENPMHKILFSNT